MTLIGRAKPGMSLGIQPRMRLGEIWRYPVKSMGGEQLTATDVGRDGIPGDRLVQVQDRRGRIVTSRSRPKLLLHHATLGPDGEALVDGRPWRQDDVAADVRAAAGPDARLVSHDELDRFDVLPLLVATDGAIAAMGYDRRRFRPNLLIAGVPDLAERTWEGRVLRVGAAVIRAVSLRQRCIMTTFDPDTAEQDTEVLLRIHRELGGLLALDCDVVEPGRIELGDPVALEPA
jgi:uncharacterized protein YcbX